MALDKVTTAVIADDAVTGTQIAPNAIEITDVAADVIPVKPHIQPGVLQPAVAGKLLNGASHSGAYGTAQTQSGGDGYSYYYTDIKGSKPIKDPRIGSHFGSQRHKLKSMQLLEQETATHGTNVYSVDGREWIRAVGASWSEGNQGWGHSFYSTNSAPDSTYFIEIVGYFSDANFLGYGGTAYDIKVSTDGGSQTTNTGMTATVTNPLGDRFVDAASLLNLGLGKTLGIHTLKLANVNGDYLGPMYGIELIAQDTQDFTATNATNILTSTGHTLTNGDQIRLTGSDLPNGLNATTTYYVIGASGNNFQVSASLGGSAVTFSDDGSGTRTFTSVNNIQIPAQDVVSYGKKFSVSATAQHHNPFAFKTDGSTAWASGAHNGTSWPVGTGASANIDTATSIGLDNWKHSNNYYKPYNGGRVVKWIASDGTIKTSVNVMPPNAQNVASSSIAAKANASIANNTFLPTFSGAIDHSQSEVAKTFLTSEFGNGAANSAGGGGTSNTYADASMLGGSALRDDIAYAMDDGLTSLSGTGVYSGSGQIYNWDNNDGTYTTFIGTGITIKAVSGTYTFAQNLPYGTHIMKYFRTATSAPLLTIDGVTITASTTDWASVKELTFHQPKMPPIPEDACILADYMLMADFVKQTDAEDTEISKGVRAVSGSRDVFCNDTGDRAFYSDATDSVFLGVNFYMGMATFYSHASTDTSSAQLPFFGTHASVHIQGSNIAHVMDFGGSTGVATTALDSSIGNARDIISIDNSATLGINTVKTTLYRGGYSFQGYDVATPIHTSSHYQTFETPYLHELVGGDRNMEQTNLVVTPDGKTWDEVTRDMSYIGSQIYRWGFTTAHLASNELHGTAGSLLLMRGGHYNVNYGGKNFTPAYDRHICLKDGLYRITCRSYFPIDSSNGTYSVKVNGSQIGVYAYISGGSPDEQMSGNSFVQPLKRGDYVQVYGGHFVNVSNAQDFYIERLGDYRNVY